MSAKAMKRNGNRVSQLLSWLVLAKILGVGAVFAPPVSAQPIISAPDGTGTIVTPNGNQFNIGGGTQSGANLYQSFQQFGLDSNQIANFLSRPDIQNILGRVVGGDASVINGLIQVTGGNSNLYLLNPSGIIFGANASLNVPASFTATTANGIQIGNNWFNATGTNDYASLNGSPNGFAFTQSGSIFNAGTLTVGAGQSVTLLGGTVVNLGTIAAPGGTITIAAIPGERLVRITQVGSLLSLDLPIATKAQLNPSSSVPLNLPALLTGSSLANATGVTVDNGVVTLNSTGAVIPTDAGTAIVSGSVSVAPSSSQSPTPSLPYSITPQITILGDKVGLLSANVDASGTNGGGTILIGGDFQGQGPVPNAQFTYVDAGTTIAADALSTGDGGKVILWADQATRFLGTISARGGALGGNGGLVETSGKVYLQALGNVDSSAANGTAGTWLLDPNDITIQTAGPDTNVTASPNFTSTNDSAIVTTGSIEAALNAGTSVTVTTASAGINSQLGDITVANNISKTAGGDATLTLNAQNSIFVNPGVQITSTANRLNVVMTGNGAIVLNNSSGISSNGGDITLDGQGNAINIEGLILNSATLNADVGNISLTGLGQPGTIGATGVYVLGGSSLQTTTGNITLTGRGGAGTDNNDGIYLDSSSITTANGTISLIGSSDGTGDDNYGILLTSTSISTVNGAISLSGQGGAGSGDRNYGIYQLAGAAITSTGTGSLSLNGTAGGSSSSNANYGIVVSGPGSRVTSGNSNITLTGTNFSPGSGINNNGILIESSGAVESIGSGVLTLNGRGGQGIQTNSSRIGSATATGAIALNADSFDLQAGTQIVGTGDLVIQPITPGTSIGLGNSAPGTLNLDTAELSSITDGFNSITIGTSSNSGTITIQSALTFNDPITLEAAFFGGSLVANSGGTIASLGNDVNLVAGENISTQAITTGGGNLSISTPRSITTNGNSLVTSGSTTGGNISLNGFLGISTGNLISAGPNVGGDISLQGGSGAVMTNDISTQGSLAGGNVDIRASSSGALTAGAIDTSSPSGNGGGVLVFSGSAQVRFINTQGGSSGTGGSVDIAPLSPTLFLATGSFVDQNGITASISTAGGTGGSIRINHVGGTSTPFIVGGATTNGTAAAITTGAGNTIAPVQSFSASYTQGNIRLLTGTIGAIPPSDPNAFDPNAPDSDGIDIDETVFTSPDEESSLDESSTDVSLGTFSGETTDLEVGELEADFTEDYGNYFGLLAETPVTAAQTQGTLNAIESATGIKSALIYISFLPAAPVPTAALPKSLPTSPSVPSEVLWQSDSQGFAFSPASELRTLSQRSQTQRDSDILQVIVMTGKEKRILKQIPETTRGQVIELARQLRQEITNADSNEYLVPSQKLYQLLIAPIEPELQSRKIDNLILIPDAGLRSLPLAVLHDGQRFLVEKYSFGIMPSFSLTDTRYKNIKTASVLAMGASKFTEQIPLAAVPAELAAIVKTRTGQTFLNEAFTLENLKLQRQKQPFNILHLATHGEFKSGEPANSYIQLWDSKLRMDQLQQLQLSNPSVDLLVLSACRTAVGDDQAELGFAGFAIQAGVKSVLASLWYVSDSGTLGLMNEFYQQLQTAPTKSEALRRAQLAMIKGQVRLERGELRGSRGGTALPPELVALGDTSLNHPYYWAAFTIVGNPW